MMSFYSPLITLDSSLPIGGADRDRTDDLRLAKPALSQLSYSPEVRLSFRKFFGQSKLAANDRSTTAPPTPILLVIVDGKER